VDSGVRVLQRGGCVPAGAAAVLRRENPRLGSRWRARDMRHRNCRV